MNLVKEESVESCVKKNAEDFFPTFEEFYSTWSALDSIEVKDGLLVNLLINEKVVSKLRENIISLRFRHGGEKITNLC